MVNLGKFIKRWKIKRDADRVIAGINESKYSRHVKQIDRGGHWGPPDRVLLGYGNRYEKAGDSYLHAGKPKKAVICYEHAKNYASRYINLHPDDEENCNSARDMIHKSNDKILRAERVEKSLSGKVKYLSGKGPDISEKVALIIAISGFILALSFLSSNFTGMAISNLNINTSNIIGVVLFFIGVIASFFYFKNKK